VCVCVCVCVCVLKGLLVCMHACMYSFILPIGTAAVGIELGIRGL
jgi:hypothetical protein